jgi:hypothetical protein
MLVILSNTQFATLGKVLRQKVAAEVERIVGEFIMTAP